MPVKLGKSSGSSYLLFIVVSTVSVLNYLKHLTLIFRKIHLDAFFKLMLTMVTAFSLTFLKLSVVVCRIEISLSFKSGP